MTAGGRHMAARSSLKAEIKNCPKASGGAWGKRAFRSLIVGAPDPGFDAERSDRTLVDPML